MLVLEQHVGEVAQQDVHVEQQVVEIHGVAIVQPLVVHLVDLSYGRAFTVDICLVDLRIFHVVFRAHEVALGHGDTAGYIGGFIGFWVEVEKFDDLLDGGLAVVGVVDGEAGCVAQFGRFGS